LELTPAQYIGVIETCKAPSTAQLLEVSPRERMLKCHAQRTMMLMFAGSLHESQPF
jgi:hypothetical protein